MTSTVEGVGGHRRIVITCDLADCPARHNDEVIAKGGGLHEMGWRKKFDAATRKLLHFCPEHQEAASE